MIPEATIADYLGLEADDVDGRALAVDAADRVLSWIESVTSRHFREPKEFVWRYSGDGTTALWIPELPNDDGESVPEPLLTVETKENREWTEVDALDYELIEMTKTGPHLLEHEKWWPIGRRNLRVTATAGYEAGQLPGDIVQLVLEMVAHRYRERGNEGLRSETIGGYSYTRADDGGEGDFRDAWRHTLEAWRHVVFA